MENAACTREGEFLVTEPAFVTRTDILVLFYPVIKVKFLLGENRVGMVRWRKSAVLMLWGCRGILK